MEDSKFIKILLGAAVLLVVAGGLLTYLIIAYQPGPPGLPPTDQPGPSITPEIPQLKIAKFSSVEEFKTYLEAAGDLMYSGFGGFGGQALIEARAVPGVLDVGLGEKAIGLGIETAAPDRVSETTVQVLGVDEPDILKTDGQQIYFSHLSRYFPVGVKSSPERIRPMPTAETSVIKAFPPADLAKITNIDKTGNLLLADNILLIFSNDQKIYGYDVSDPSSPEEKWNIKLAERNYLVQARLYDDKIYLVTQQRIDSYRPCPIQPLSIGGQELTVACAEIYHPLTPVPVDVTYTAMVINPTTGQVEDKVSFIGSSGTTVVYMSKNALYTTYSFYPDTIDFIYRFFYEKMSDLIPASVMKKLENLTQYAISNQAKMTEFSVILAEFHNSLDQDDRLKIENEMTNRMKDYLDQHQRELEQTGIVKISLDGFDVSATGQVPGQPLNQFSLDEYQNHLRIATTISGRMFFGSGESVSDVNILDSNLNLISSVKDLGKGERIYSVRFVENKGYVVTFKQIDPFYVLDLSNPQKPELKGELKIPGYSSYLHPITKDKILGIGKEGSQVKLSLFDVSLPENPTEVSKYLLDEYWSDVLNTHHAFLLDTKHGVFFLPGSKGGYVFSYKNNGLKLEKAVSDIQAKRALYLDDYLYIVGEDKLIVLNEINWERVNELEL